MAGFEIRGAVPSDEEQLFALARHLNTVNLPNDRDEIRAILEASERSFKGAIKDPKRREFVFVLVDDDTQRIVGTSMIFGQLGRRDAPYIYLDVIDEERYSATLDKHFKHTVLKIGYSYNGPTEIGGLILLPDYRRVPEKLGLLLSYVRFLWIRMHREAFRDEVLAELLARKRKHRQLVKLGAALVRRAAEEEEARAAAEEAAAEAAPRSRPAPRPSRGSRSSPRRPLRRSRTEASSRAGAASRAARRPRRSRCAARSRRVRA